MVCLVSPVLKSEQPTMKPEENLDKMNTDEVIFDENFEDEYNLVQIAGGSLIEYPPLFTENGKYLLVISGRKVVVYSTTTGEWIRDLEEFGKSEMIAIELSLNDPKILIGCSVRGEVVLWDWKRGTIQSCKKLPVFGNTMKTFTLLKMQFGLSCLVTYKNRENNMKFDIINLEKNAILNCPIELKLQNDENIKSVAENNFFHYFVIAQSRNLLVVDYKTWNYKMWKNAHKVNISVVKVHPSELLIATGDEIGKIFLYREVFKHGKDPMTTLYHWHHTPVTSIAFTMCGSGFYSGGHESVLVKWQINRPHMKNFFPRMTGYIRHIVVGDNNKKLAICSAENSIQIFDDQNQQKCVLQNFTFVYDNKTGQDRFPVGLLLNPVNNTLALNGRFGHLQFFSTYTKSLLYNTDIVMQNKLSTEVQKILYDIIVTTAAFNVNWMATGEQWNDHENFPEVRLKFWEFKKEKQNYSLNTSIELPHEGGIRAIKFSNSHSVENLLCATLGNDDFVKIWSLESSDDGRSKKYFWVCVAKTKYKDFRATSLDFTADGSLVAVGYENTLCVYKSDTLKLKAVLTAPPSYDGSLQKIQICYNEEKLNSLIKMNGNHKKILEIFRKFEQNIGDKGIVKILQQSSLKKKSKISAKTILSQNKNSELLFKKILGIPELNLFQKLLVFQKLNISYSVPSNIESKIISYLNTKLNKENKEMDLHKIANFLNKREKFKAKYRLKKYYCRKNLYQNKVNEILTPLLSLLKIEDTNEDIETKTTKSGCNGYANGSVIEIKEEVKRRKVNEESKFEGIPFNLQSISEIKSVNFGKGDYAHLIIVTTEHRVIIWNILTLRIQFVLKLSVKKMIVDDLTSLCAALTINNELFVFLPNTNLCIYRRSQMPDILSACWVPKKFPRSTFLDLDWQCFSILYFLTSKQELVYLSSTKDEKEIDSIAFINDPSEIRHSLYDVYSSKKLDKITNQTFDKNTDRIGVPGKGEIKSIIQMASHTSAPMSLLCDKFIQSLLVSNDGQTESSADSKIVNKLKKMEIDSDEETDEIFAKIKEKKKRYNLIFKNLDKTAKSVDQKQLNRILMENVPTGLEF